MNVLILLPQLPSTMTQVVSAKPYLKNLVNRGNWMQHDE